MGERLLCKQGVVGSNPIASMEQGGMADPRQRLPPPKPSAGCTRGHGAGRCPRSRPWRSLREQ